MSDEGHNCFIIVFSQQQHIITAHIFLYLIGLCHQLQKKTLGIYINQSDNHFHIFFFPSNILAMSSSMHRVILIFSSGISWAGDMAILDALQTNYAVGSLAREKWNVWTVTIALLPVIVNFCEAWFLIVRQFHLMKIF